MSTIPKRKKDKSASGQPDVEYRRDGHGNIVGQIHVPAATPVEDGVLVVDDVEERKREETEERLRPMDVAPLGGAELMLALLLFQQITVKQMEVVIQEKPDSIGAISGTLEFVVDDEEILAGLVTLADSRQQSFTEMFSLMSSEDFQKLLRGLSSITAAWSARINHLTEQNQQLFAMLEMAKAEVERQDGMERTEAGILVPAGLHQRVESESEDGENGKKEGVTSDLIIA